MSSSEYQRLTNLISSYSDIFASPNGELGRTDRIRHTIDTGDARPIKQAPRRLPPYRREVIEQEIDKMLAQGIIEPSDSPWAAPIVLVSKKDGTTHFCVDYQKLNNVIRKEAYPIPLIGEALDTLSGSVVWVSGSACSISQADIGRSEWMIKTKRKLLSPRIEVYITLM